MRKKFLQGISANVILLGLVSFINDASSDMIFAVLPIFIVSLGGAGLAVGLIGGLADTVSGILKVFSGYWSDKLGIRKPFIFWGYLTSSITKILFPFARVWQNLAFLVSVERVGKGLRTAPRDAVIAGSTTPGLRGRAFGIHRALDTSGAFIGALAAFVLFWLFKLELKSIIFIAAIISFFAIIPIPFIKEKQASLQQKLSFKISLKNLPLNFKRYVTAATIFSLSTFTYMFFILKSKVVFDNLFSPRLAAAIPILLYVYYNFIYALASIPAGIISDKIGRKKILVLGYLVYSFTCIGFSLANSLSAFVVLFAVYGISFGLIEGNQRAFASDFVANDLSGTALGTLHTCVTLANLPAGIIAGLLWNFNPAYTFVFAAVMGIIGAVFLMRVKPAF